MITTIGKACFAPGVNKALTALNNGNSNWGLWFQDLGAFGRVYQEYDRNKHGGRETAIEETTTSIVWGGFIPAGKMAVDKFAPKFSKNLSMPNLDLRLLNKSNPQQLTPGIVDEYFKHANPALEKEAKQKLLTMAENGTETAQKAAKSLINKNRMFQFAKVSGIGFTASVILGFGLPKFNQAITRLCLDKEKAKSLATPTAQQPNTPSAGITASAGTAPVMNSLNAKNSLGFNSPQPISNAMNPFTGATGLPTNIAAQKLGVHFGGAGLVNQLKDFGGLALQRLQENDQMTTLAFSDIPLSSGRVLTSRRKDEKVEKLVKEGGIILALFVIQPFVKKKLAGQSEHIGYPVLMKLYEMYGKQQAAGKFMESYGEIQKQLGVKGKLASYFEAAKDKPQQVQAQVKQMRDYFNTKKPQAQYKSTNLLFDMAAEDDKIPTLQLGGKDARPHIDITRKIDMDGVKSMAQYLDDVAKESGTKIKQQLTQTASHKLGAFVGSTAVCWSLMSYALPKFQHYVTYKRTGKDYFPGLDPDAETPAMAAAK